MKHHKISLEIEFDVTYYQSIAVISLPDYMDNIIRVSPPGRPEVNIIIEIAQNQFGEIITLRWFDKGEIRSVVPRTEKKMVDITYTSKQLDRQKKLDILLQVNPVS